MTHTAAAIFDQPGWRHGIPARQNFARYGAVAAVESQLALSLDNRPDDFSARRKLFLDRLRSPSNPQKYKRYLGSPLRYAGGKSLAVGLIIEQLPARITRLVSPFFGGGSVEIACAKELELKVVGFDIFDLLVNYWQQQFSHAEALHDCLKQFAPTKESFFKVKELLKGHWLGERPIMSKIDLAALYYFNHNTSYGPGFLSWPSYVYMNEKRYAAMLDKARQTQANKISVKALSFDEVLPRYRQDFLYCDPPYFLAGDSKMFRGIYPQRNFPIHHNGFGHERLRDLLHAHRGGFILSYNDCSTIRDWYRDFEIIDVAWQYTMGQGETRIGANRIASQSDHVKRSHEILIVKR